VTVVEQSDLSTPKFCISVKPDCLGHGIGFDTFDITEVNSKGEYIEGGQYINLMWSLKPMSENSEIKEFTYGDAPNGWYEKIRSKPLNNNTYYTVNGKIFFRVNEREGKIELLDYAEFRSQ